MRNYKPGLKVVLALIPLLILIIVVAQTASNTDLAGDESSDSTATPTVTTTATTQPVSTGQLPTAIPTNTPIIVTATSVPIPTITPVPTAIIIPTVTIPTPTSLPTPIVIIQPTPTSPVPEKPTATSIPTATATPTIVPTPIIVPKTSTVLIEDVGPRVYPLNLSFGDYVIKVLSVEDISIDLKFYGGCTRNLVDGIGPHVSSHIIKISNPTRCEGPSLLPGESFNLIINTSGEYTISFSKQYPNQKSLPIHETNWGSKLFGPVILSKGLNNIWIRTETNAPEIEVYVFSLNNVVWSYSAIHEFNLNNASRSIVHQENTGTYLIYVRTSDNVSYTLGIE